VSERPTFLLDGEDVPFTPGQTVLQAALTAGMDHAGGDAVVGEQVGEEVVGDDRAVRLRSREHPGAHHPRLAGVFAGGAEDHFRRDRLALSCP